MRKRGRSRHAGVADYFAVLGIDWDDDGGGGDGSGVDGEGGRDGTPSATDGRGGDGSDDGNGRSHDGSDDDGRSSPPPRPPSDMDAGHAEQAEFDRSHSQHTVQTGNLSAAKTPRNDNLSRKRPQQREEGICSSVHEANIPEGAPEGSGEAEDTEEEAPSNDDEVGGGNSQSANEQHEPPAPDEEQRMRAERFQREIVAVALVSRPSRLDSNWTCVEGATLSLHGNDVRSSQYCEVHLAYRRRGAPNHNDDDDENDTDGSERATCPQHYYVRGIADVSVRYAKVRPSTLPHFTSHAQIYPKHEPQQTNAADMQNPQPSPVKSTVAAGLYHGAKQLSTFAKRAGWTLPPAGKELAAGLVGAVTSRSPVDLLSNLNAGGNEGNGMPADGAAATTAQTHSSPPRHLWDAGGGSFETDVTGAVHQFDAVHGDVKPWRSPSEVEGESDVFSGVTSSNGGVHSEVGRATSPAGEKGRGSKRQHFFPDTPMPQCSHKSGVGDGPGDGLVRRALHDMLPLPEGYDEWAVPDVCAVVHLPTPERARRRRDERQRLGAHRPPILMDRTHTLPSPSATPRGGGTPSSAGAGSVLSPSSIGMEAMYLSPTPTPREGAIRGTNESPSTGAHSPVLLSHTQTAPDPAYLPSLASMKSIPSMNRHAIPNAEDDAPIYVPILAVRRQRIGEEERYHEDPAAVDVRVAVVDADGAPPRMDDDEDDDDDYGRGSSTLMQTGAHPDILKKSKWTPSSIGDRSLAPGQPVVFLKRNVPNGLADLPFPAAVLDRFPKGNYRGMPFPEEELPLFCYAGGSRLVREEMRNGGLPKIYGFVVKNERGDSIYVSCLTFMEPLTERRKQQLRQLSIRRRHSSLPHRAHCQRMTNHASDMFTDRLLVKFDDTVTFENKTLVLVGRYPYWTEFRRFLTHLHLLSGSSSDIPLERHISHLLLSVPVPKPGGQAVLVPFSTMPADEPMALVMPPLKDLPLVDLGYASLFGCLDVPTVATIVLGFLCLERKVILISTRQSLLLDCCELLKSLLFPFELCAPYVPHLTRPFMSCLEFPGALFVGIHDDGKDNGLAKEVRDSIPEDSIIVELDTGEINCDGNRYETLKAAYQIIPADSRSLLLKEIETLCEDAGIVPGQEPLDQKGIGSAIDCTTCPASNMAQKFGKHQHHDPLDDRAVRDGFLRFFCSILGGYERFLVVPDADFLTSGNDWFDSGKFVASAATNRRPFLGTLVETQLFQSFVQRRTEASDVHCMLFDECLAEYHSSTLPYGRLSDNAGSNADLGEATGQPHLDYNLLVDQCATEPDILLEEDESGSFLNRSDIYNKSLGIDNDTATQASSGYADSAISDTPSIDRDTSFAINASGDIVTIPSTAHLPRNTQYSYYIDGNPSFPTKFDQSQFLPKEPESLEAESSSETPPPILTRSEREREDAVRMCNMTVSRGGPQRQHRCLWQLAKFMGSQFLGAWLMCIPGQISQQGLSIGMKSKILLRALGALRTLRSHRRIVADEAAYRALIAACGRCGTDRRTELMKLYGLMRSDGIFPNSITLGQYTRAIAEGYSNVNVDSTSGARVGMQVVISSSGARQSRRKEGFDLEVLVNNSILEESGMKWRTRDNVNSATGGGAQPAPKPASTALKDGQDHPQTISPSKTFDTATTQRSVKTKRSWLPVTCSSSFRLESVDAEGSLGTDTVRLFALWSRTTACKACSYIPLDEEVQSGWDIQHDKLETVCTVACPRCAGMILPLIGYEEMTVDQTLDLEATGRDSNDSAPTRQASDLDVSGVTQDSSLLELPPQLELTIRDGFASAPSAQQERSGFVTYLSPQKLRTMLEEIVLEFGEEVLNRDRLRNVNSEVFFNLWWYSARFSLPLPLAVASLRNEVDDADDDSDGRLPSATEAHDCCAFASWDKSVALHGCQSAAKAIVAAQSLPYTSNDRLLREKLFDNPNTDIPLLSFFNLQNYAQGDWDHPDFSEILVALVKACETRDLLPVVECVFKRNKARQDVACDSGPINASFESVGTMPFSVGASSIEASCTPVSTELDCYRTILYLARYQCTTAFHAFFPTTIRACKGYHFWCAQGTAPLPIFDRAFREAAESYCKERKMLVPIPEVSDIALSFRSVFGHIL